MVIFYNLDDKKIKRIEDNVMLPTLPFDMDIEEKINYYKIENEGFISLPYELGANIWNFDLCFDSNDNFIGIQPK